MCALHHEMILFFNFLLLLHGLSPHCLYLFNCKYFSIYGSCVGWITLSFIFYFQIFFSFYMDCFISTWIWPTLFWWFHISRILLTTIETFSTSFIF